MSKGSKKPASKGKKDDDFDFLGQFGSNDIKINLKDPALMKELQGMGWDDEDDMDIDPELADLERQIEEEEENEPVHHGKEMTAEEIENAQFDDDDLNHPDLLAELEEAEGNDKVNEVDSRIEELKEQIEITRQNAIKEKQRGNKEAALNHLKLMKSLQVELESSEQLLNVHKLAQKNIGKNSKKNTDAPPPEDDFDYTSIVSVTALEFEKERAEQRKQLEVVETIEMQITIISNNIEFGVLSQEDYAKSLKDKVAEYKEIVKSGKDRGTYAKHIELMEKELNEMEEMAEEEEEEAVVEEPKPVEVKAPEPMIDHELLMQNIKYRLIYESFEEGKEAFKYLKGLGKEDLSHKLMEKLEKWQEVIQSYRSGKQPKIEVKPFSSQDITGCSEVKRRERLQELIEFSTGQVVKFKELALSALRQKDKEQAVVYKKEMLGYEQKVKQLEGAMTNPWQIPPEVTIKSFVKTVPQVNEDVEPGVLEVTYGKAAGFSDGEDYLITYSLVAGDTLSGTTERFSKICEKGVNHTFTIKIDPKNFNSLFKKHMIFEVFEYHRIRSNKSQGTSNIKLEGLSKQCTFKTLLQLSRKGPQIDLTFRIHKSLSVPEVKQVVEKLQHVEDLCTPFKSIEGKIIKSGLVRTSVIEESKAEEVKSDTNFDDIGQDEFDNPNVIRNLISFEVLEIEIERLKKIIIETRSNGNNADKIMNFQRELMKNKSIIEAQVGSGVISPEQYKEVLEGQVQHDMKLAQFYKEKGKREHLLTVVNRVKIMKKEIEELNSSS